MGGETKARRWTIYVCPECGDTRPCGNGHRWNAAQPVSVMPVGDGGEITDEMVERALAEMDRRDLFHTSDDGYDVGACADEEDALAVLRAALGVSLDPTEQERPA